MIQINLTEILDEIRTKSLIKLLSKSSSVGNDLNKIYFSFMEIKEIIYDCLKNIELREVEKRWSK